MKVTNIILVLSAFILLPLQTIAQELVGEGEPKTADEAYRRAARFLQTRRLDEALSMFSKAILLKPDWAEAFAARARALSQAKRYAEEITDLDEAIRLDPGHAAWFNGRGLAYSNLNQHSRAIGDYAKAIQLSPTSGVYYSNRGWAYGNLDQFENAIADLSRAIQLAPEYVKAYENRAKVYARMKDWRKAIADYTAAIQIAPSAWQYQARSEARLAAGDQEGAEDDQSKSRVQAAIATNSAAPGSYRMGNGITAPRVSYKVEPNYSEEARLAGFEGTVVLSLVVNPDGIPRDLRVIRSLGLGLDEKAVEAVSQWKFLPGLKEGQPVPVQASIEVNFRLLADKTKSPGWRLVNISFQPQVGASRPQLVKSKHLGGSDSDGPASITVSFDVDEDGVPANLHVDKSSDPRWEHKMLEVVKAWRFNPGLRQGQAVATHCTLNFALGR